MFGEARVYDMQWQGSRVRVLDIEGTFQSATYLDERWCIPPFPYLALSDCVFEASPAAQDLCMLGGGGYAFPKYVIACHSSARIDVVEIDPAVTSLARTHFFLDRLIDAYGTGESGRLGLVCDDALAYLLACSRRGRRYDAILNDCYQATSFDSSLVAPQALRLAHACLNEGGLYLINVISALEGDDAAPLIELVSLLGEEFAHVLALTCGDREPLEADNIVVIACDHDPHLRDAMLLR